MHEKFWTLEKNGQMVPTEALGTPTSIGQFRGVADTARFADDLWQLLLVKEARDVLRQTLLTTYFPQTDREQAAQVTDTDPVLVEAERLKYEARQKRFRPKPMPLKVREADTAYLRHWLFPRVVTGLYGNACAICRLQVRDDGGAAIVDAAHIQPFAQFHNDDPRNGLSLCKNHHWGFDHGWLSVSETYAVLVSPRLRGDSAVYAEAGKPILLPNEAAYAPASEALAWHRHRWHFD